jgi:hypothetical protein
MLLGNGPWLISGPAYALALYCVQVQPYWQPIGLPQDQGQWKAVNVVSNRRMCLGVAGMPTAQYIHETISHIHHKDSITYCGHSISVIAEHSMKQNTSKPKNIPSRRIMVTTLFQIGMGSTVIRLIGGLFIGIIVILCMLGMSQILHFKVPSDFRVPIMVWSISVEILSGFFRLGELFLSARQDGLEYEEIDRREKILIALMAGIDGTLGAAFSGFCAATLIARENSLDLNAAGPLLIISMILSAGARYTSKWIVEAFVLPQFE